jgi:hypothetical protein
MGKHIQKVQKIKESGSVNYEEIQNLIASLSPFKVFKDFEVYKVLEGDTLSTYYIKKD